MAWLVSYIMGGMRARALLSYTRFARATRFARVAVYDGTRVGHFRKVNCHGVALRIIVSHWTHTRARASLSYAMVLPGHRHGAM